MRFQQSQTFLRFFSLGWFFVCFLVSFWRLGALFYPPGALFWRPCGVLGRLFGLFGCFLGSLGAPLGCPLAASVVFFGHSWALFGLPLGVVMFAFWILMMLNQNQNSGNQENPPPKESNSNATSYRSPNLTQCRTCKKDVSRNAQSCPYCGEPNFDATKTTSQKKAENRKAGEAMSCLLYTSDAADE